MKTNPILVALIALSLSCAAFAADPAPKEAKEANATTEAKDAKGALYHVVSIKFKEGATPEQIKAVEDAFAALKTKVPGVTSLHYGSNVSPENRNKGYTHCFILTFATEKDRDVYLKHPEHQAFGKVLGPVLGDVMVIDFWGKE
jgi:hypothetical protein